MNIQSRRISLARISLFLCFPFLSVAVAKTQTAGNVDAAPWLATDPNL